MSDAAFDAAVKRISERLLARLPVPKLNKRRTGYDLSDPRKDPSSQVKMPGGTVVLVHSTGSTVAYPVRFTSLNDTDARDKARDDFISWAVKSLDGISRGWFRALHGLEKCSKLWRRKYASSKVASWSDEDDLTMDIADILLLAEFVSFVHKQTLPASSKLAQLMEDEHRLEQKINEWLVGARGLASAASQLRRCLRLELNQYAVVQPAQWPVLLDGTCVELRSSNVPAAPALAAAAPAPAPARTRGNKAAGGHSGGGGGGGGSTANAKSSGSSIKCFRCHGKGHTFQTCNNAPKPLKQRKAYVYTILGNPPTPAYEEAASKYLLNDILKRD